ncbi:Chaperone protein ClpB [compost metagenome]
MTEEEIADIVSRWTGVPVTRLVEGERDKLLRLEDTLHWLRRSGLTPLTEICIGLPLASRSAAALLTSVLGGEIQVYSLPLQVNPFQRSGKLIGMLDQLLDGTGKLAVSAKRKRWFQKKN